ncbi:hypothetical protein IAR55_006516 [Kwoniella newhampshirensis]|uniref:tRNA-dihydrouridine(16/17) synthase [NAD(P)(+)] n=1 Tax=Kwoniella newhampshirensis TaxID=1651941 RepID=A0AAW0YRD3_9TREE
MSSTIAASSSTNTIITNSHNNVPSTTNTFMEGDTNGVEKPEGSNAAAANMNGEKPKKLGGYDFYRSIGSPRYVVAPMVDQSELAWRLLSRSPLPPSLAGPSSTIATLQGKTYIRHPGGADICYTPMIHAKVFMDAKGEGGRNGDGQFNLTFDEEGGEGMVGGVECGDRPLIVQFCANDPDILLAAAKKIEHRCDAVDINFGCPQGIAKRGHYGSFLQDEWDLIHKLISTLHQNLSVPVTAKFRIFPDLAKTIAYAQMMEAAGAQILTCHGRTREMKGQLTGLADWEMIREVKKAVKVPVFANGNLLYREDVDRCLEVTGCDGVMTAEGNLSNPAIFLPADHPHSHPPLTLLASRYLDIVESLKTATAGSAIKAHLFRLLKPVLDTDEELRIKIAACTWSDGLGGFRDIIRDIEGRVEAARKEAGPEWRPPPIDPTTGYRALPIFAAQPQIRPIPVSTEIGGHEDMVTRPASPTSASGLSNPIAPASSIPGTILASRQARHSMIHAPPCIHEDCLAVAASRCPTRACIVHCRAIRAVESGLTEVEAEAEAQKGGLVGMGCEAHEEKMKARKDRMDRKRKNKQEARERAKSKKVEGRAVVRTSGRDSPRSDMDEETFVAAVAGGTATMA